jgi:protein SCO1/2
MKLLPLVLSLGLASTSTMAKCGKCGGHMDDAKHEHDDHAHHEHHDHDHGVPSISGGDDPHAHHRAMLKQKAGAPKSARVDLRDRELLDENGNSVMFVKDVIGDNIVVMDFVYTTCTTICPVLTAVMGQVQEKLGDDLGQGVKLVSMTVDAARDTPPRLKAYAANHGAKEGWSWITGPMGHMEDVLTGLGAYSANFEDHAPMVLVGDGKTGEWSRFFGFPNADRIIEQVNNLKASRQDAAGG